MSKSLPFAIQMARMSEGEEIKHFKSLENKKTNEQVKIFFTPKKVMVVSISGCRKLVEVVALLRRKNTSLLPIEACINTCLKQGVSIGAIAKETGLTIDQEDEA